MATLFKASGGTTSLLPTTSWAAPNALFPTTDRNDSSAYSWSSSTSTVTLPSTGLADGYLLVAAFEFEDTSNGRHNPSGRFIQASGTGTFVSAATSGYNRDNSEDRSYVRTWAFVDGPSASSTFTFQWTRDSDTPTGGTVRSEVQVIPLFYSDVGVYSSTTTTATGGTTPTQVPGWSGTDGTNITLSTNVVSVTGDNSRYLVLGGMWHDGLGASRTQRWFGLEIDGSFDNSAKGYAYSRNSSNDEIGELFTQLIETSTATRTIEVNQYRGDGVLASEGGANVDGNTTSSVGAHALVVIELNSSAEVFFSASSANSSNLATTGPVDLTPFPTGNFNSDSASFTRVSDTAVNCEQATDVLFGANVSAAQNTVSTGTRWTAFAEVTINGTEDSDSFAGDYMRSNQSSQDTFGYSANLIGFVAVAANDDIGFSVTELTGSEGGGGNIDANAGWVGAWGINLDTLEGGAQSFTLTADTQSYTLTGINTDLLLSSSLAADTVAFSLTGVAADLDKSVNLTADTVAFNLTGVVTGLTKQSDLTANTEAFSLTGFDTGLDKSVNLVADTAAFALTGVATGLLKTSELTADTVAFSLTGIDTGLDRQLSLAADTEAFTLTGIDANLSKSVALIADTVSFSLGGQPAGLVRSLVLPADQSSFALTGIAANLQTDLSLTADSQSYTLTGIATEFLLGSTLLADVQAFTLTGVQADFLVSRQLTADTASYTLTGFNASLSVGERLLADSASFALTGLDTGLAVDSVLTADTTAYALTGVAANLSVGSILTADTASYVITGTDTGLDVGNNVVFDPASFSISGLPAGTLVSRRLDADTASFALTGVDADLSSSTTLVADAAAFAVTGFDLEGFTAQQTSTLTADTANWEIFGYHTAGLSKSFVNTSSVGAAIETTRKYRPRIS